MSFEDSLHHFRTSRRLSQPLASGLFARDQEEEHRKFQDTQSGREQPPTVSQSVPDGREYWSRGQYRGSSRAEPGHQLLGGDASMASSLSLAEPTKIYASGGSRLPISLSTEGLQVAKRPLGPLPEELVDKLRGLTQARDEGTKQPLTVDVSGKRTEKEKEREETPMTSPPPTSSTTRSKGSLHSAAPSKSAL
ncbi:hypothetical protein FRC00_005489 [Tulasnella sp. 408]|nr:hypothetical protein FRC00_005489 [Tulasnella sp. 408]